MQFDFSTFRTRIALRLAASVRLAQHHCNRQLKIENHQ